MTNPLSNICFLTLTLAMLAGAVHSEEYQRAITISVSCITVCPSQQSILRCHHQESRRTWGVSCHRISASSQPLVAFVKLHPFNPIISPAGICHSSYIPLKQRYLRCARLVTPKSHPHRVKTIILCFQFCSNIHKAALIVFLRQGCIKQAKFHFAGMIFFKVGLIVYVIYSLVTSWI